MTLSTPQPWRSSLRVRSTPSPGIARALKPNAPHTAVSRARSLHPSPLICHHSALGSQATACQSGSLLTMTLVKRGLVSPYLYQGIDYEEWKLITLDADHMTTSNPRPLPLSQFCMPMNTVCVFLEVSLSARSDHNQVSTTTFASGAPISTAAQQESFSTCKEDWPCKYSLASHSSQHKVLYNPIQRLVCLAERRFNWLLLR